jgi:NAD(P)-dependent dehydrogenase (short-subunit alcohol dehydrogenase family)
MKVLVLGGYGTFGGRLVRLLADRAQLTLLVAGRSGAKAQSFCSRVEAYSRIARSPIATAAKLVPLSFDRDGDLVGQLRDAAPDMVVDASGPFQLYGDDPYGVVKACLQIVPTLFPGLKSVWVGAGMAPAILHRGLSLCAFLVRIGVLPTLLPFSGIMHAARRRLSWGADRGGMFVAVSGLGANGDAVEREWHAIAEGDDGPFIPAMAAAAVIGHVLDGRRPAAGARAGTADVELADYECNLLAGAFSLA